MKCSKTKIEKLGNIFAAIKPHIHEELDKGKRDIRECLLKLHKRERELFYEVQNDWNLKQKHRELCSVPLGEVAELVDQWYSKQQGIVLKKNPDKYGIDFFSEAGMEDTKFCPKETQNFFVEFLNRQSDNVSWKQSGHFAELGNGTEVFLRFIDRNGCYRIKLSEHTWNPNQLCTTRVNTKGWWVFKETFEKVWEW